MKIATIVGARPQFIKASPVSRAIAESNRSRHEQEVIDEFLIHTGQHYDYDMSGIFFKSLGLNAPKYNLGVGSGTHCAQISKMISELEVVLTAENPDWVLVYGDTNSTFAGAFAAERLRIPIAHVESGLRSFNRTMPEECNRVLTDRLSSLLFAPTQTAVDNLMREGISNGVHLVGDVMYEAALHHGDKAENLSPILRHLGLERKSFSLATIHRAENTDDFRRLSSIVEALLEISASQPVVWPMHPRTRQHFSQQELTNFVSAGLRVTCPASYFDMLLLERSANVILTDSGGVQKEAMWFQVPCVTLRDETEWVETVESGWNRLAGSRKEDILLSFQRASQMTPSPIQHPFGGRSASDLIAERLRDSVPSMQ